MSERFRTRRFGSPSIVRLPLPPFEGGRPLLLAELVVRVIAQPILHLARYWDGASGPSQEETRRPSGTNGFSISDRTSVAVRTAGWLRKPGASGRLTSLARVVVVIAAASTPSVVSASAKVEPCHHNNKDCVCTTYFGSAGYTEVRCPSEPPVGWVAVPPRPPVAPNSGSWRGDGREKPEQTPPPFLALSTQDLNRLTLAKSTALVKLKKILIEPGPPRLLGDSSCTALFDESPLGLSGAALLSSYVRFRYVPSGSPECAADYAFVRRDQDHDRYIILCRSFFDLSDSDRDAAANVVIHELLHVGGQQGDGTTSVGPPSDYPTSRELSEAVDSACSPPVPIF